MIAMWNRKEVYVGQSVDRNNSQIMGASRSSRGTWGQDSNYTYTYYVYVHKRDYEFASFIVGKLNG